MAKKSKKKPKDTGALIAQNKKARHDYFIEENYEAGLVLEGWEVKSLRDKHVQLKESYVVVRNAEAYLLGCHITPMATASTHINPDPTRTRKLLMHRRELSKLIGLTERAGYTLVPLDLHWSKGRAKLAVGLAKGKKQHDKRDTLKDRDWKREQERAMKSSGR